MPSVWKHFTNPHHLSLNLHCRHVTTKSSSSMWWLQNWAYSYICGTQRNTFYMTPISYHHQPSSSDYDGPWNSASGSGSLSSPIPLAQFYTNHGPIVNITPSIATNLPPIQKTSSTNNWKCKSAGTAPGAPSSKWPQANKENTPPHPSATLTSLSLVVPGVGPSSKPIDSSPHKHPTFYKTSHAQHLRLPTKYSIWCLVVCPALWHTQKTLWAATTFSW